jgi:predicted nuclease of predicted toxin-antitoxin system
VVKFLIDECLSLDLVDLAWERGFTQSSHVVWLGKAGWKDWELKPFILDGDLTFVTRDSVDFRGPAEHPAPKVSTQMWPSMRDWSV